MPKVLKTIWDEFVYGGHLHSIGIALMIYSATIIFGRPADFYFLIVIYSGIHSAYLFNRYKEMSIDLATNPERTTHLRLYARIIPFIVVFLLFLSAFLLFYYAGILAFTVGTAMFIIGLLYSIYFKKFTKKIICFKNFFIAVSFSSLLILYLVCFKMPVNSESILIFTTLFIFICIRSFSNTIFFDLKDISSDDEEGLKTFPVLYGQNKTIGLMRWLNFASGVVILVSIVFMIIPLYSIALILLIPFVEYYVYLSKLKKSNIRFISAFYADGEYSLCFLLIVIGKFIYEQF